VSDRNADRTPHRSAAVKFDLIEECPSRLTFHRLDALEKLVSNCCWVALAQATKARIQLLKIGTFYH